MDDDLKKILVVEDDIDTLSIIAVVLRHYGLSVVIARDGIAAIEILEQDKRQSVVLVITDYHMPRMDGIQLCSELKARFHQVKGVIFITAVPNSLNLTGLGGFCRILEKPISIGALIKSISELMPSLIPHSWNHETHVKKSD